MQCPHDQTTMREIAYEGVPIHSCDECGGEFVAASAMAHIVRTREERFPAELRDALMHCRPTFLAPPRAADRAVECPACATAMTVLNYAGDSGVMVDRCPGCGGLWLDREELERVQILTERWKDDAPQQIQAIAGALEAERHRMATQTNAVFSGSRFAFVNAVINCLLDAA